MAVPNHSRQIFIVDASYKSRTLVKAHVIYIPLLHINGCSGSLIYRYRIYFPLQAFTLGMKVSDFVEVIYNDMQQQAITRP